MTNKQRALLAVVAALGCACYVTCASPALAQYQRPGVYTKQNGVNQGFARYVDFRNCTVVFNNDSGVSTVDCKDGGTFPVPPTCNDGGAFLTWDGGAFGCGPAPTPGSGLCNDGGVALTWNGSAYTCGTVASLPTPAGLCNDGGVATNWNGSAFTCGVVGQGQPTTVLDCDFVAVGTDAGTLALDAGDGNYSVCAQTFVILQSTAYATRPDVTSVGLHIQPVSATEWGNGGATTAPVFYIPVANIAGLANLGALTPLRMTVAISWNGSTSGDAFETGIWNAVDLRYQGVIFFSGGATPYWSPHSFVGTSFQVFTNTATFGSSDSARMVTIDWPNGIAGRPNLGLDFPDGGAFPPSGGGRWAMSAPADSNANIAWMYTLTSSRFILTARRGANAHTGFAVDVKRIKIEAFY